VQRPWLCILILPAILALASPARAETERPAPPLAGAFCAGELWTVGERPWLRLTRAATDDQVLQYSRWAMAVGGAVLQHARMLATAAVTPEDPGG
jgi:hypothetical protein